MTAALVRSATRAMLATMAGILDYRPLGPGDHGAAADLWGRTEGLGPIDPAAALARFLARNPGLSQAAWADGRLVGVVLASCDGIRGMLSRLAVDSEHRRRGIARELVRRAVAALRAEGADRGLILVLPDNEAALRFWRQEGWQDHGSVRLCGLRFTPAE